MSMELMVKAMKIKVGNPLRKLVLLKLADNANDQGECWPSYQHIADQCEIGRSTVKSHVRALEEMGMIRREFRRNGEINQSNLFHLSLDEAQAKVMKRGRAGAEPGQELPEVGHDLPEGGAVADRGGRAGADPRTSHSFEPVIEPVIEPKSNGASANAAEPSRTGKQDYSAEFEAAWLAYPKRAGGNPKPSAWKAWSARLREGISAAEMLAGVQRYAVYVTNTRKAGTEYVKQAATFFGPDHHFAESWAVPSQQRSTPAQNRHSGFGQRDYGNTKIPSWASEEK
ncbi:helix-turn-helix domain-containing protein [Cronobacter malonaticus]